MSKAPWERAGARLETLLTERTGVEVTVSALGIRDNFTGIPVAGSGIPIHLAGGSVLVGGRCGCCLARRWKATRSRAVRDAVELGAEVRATGEPPVGSSFVVDALAALVLRRVEENDTSVDMLDLKTLLGESFPLLPDSGCPKCGIRATDEPTVPELVRTPKIAADIFRTRRIADYRLPVKALVNEVCGALGPRMITELSSRAVSRAGGFFSVRTGDYLAETQWSGHADSFRDSAQIGLVEGLERLAHTVPRSSAPVVASLAELGTSALDPRTCGLYPDECYEQDDHVVPFSPDEAIPWVWAYSLRDHRSVLVPEIQAYQHSSGAGPRFTQECSNGCASGGSLAEAVHHGLLELIERDAFLSAWYGKVELPEIDPAGIARSGTRNLLNRLEMYGYRVRFFDTRSCLPVPVVTAVAVRADGGLGALCFGAGANLSPEAAVASGLAEVAAIALRLGESTRSEESRLRVMAEDFTAVRELNDHWRLFGLPEMSKHADFLLSPRESLRSLDSLTDGLDPAASSPDLVDGLRWTVDQLGAAGFDVLVVDQTLPEQRALGLHTAAVIVPGLLPIDFGWHRQRALSMLRQRGTTARPAGELHLVPHPFP